MRKSPSKIRSYSMVLLSTLLALGIAYPNAASASSFKLPEDTTIHFDSKLKQGNWKKESLDASTLSRLNELSASEKPQNYVDASDSNDPITVIVQLQNDPIKVYEVNPSIRSRSSIGSYSSILSQEHTKFKSAAISKTGAQFRREYSSVFNGYSVTLPANQVDTLLTLPGVKAVFPNAEVQALPVADGHEMTPKMDESAPLIGADEMWKSGYKGKGIKVGVIDTGIDYHHPSLEGAYQGGYDFVDNDDDPMETLPDPSKPVKDGNTYDTYHGTHVSGTVAGQGDPEHPDAGKGWVRGVAPEAELYVYRVLGPYGSGSNENVIAGIERAVHDDMDVINLSLGSKFNNEYSPDAIAADNAALAGVTVVLANGNEGPGDETVSSPATAQLAISVGASTPPLQTPIFTTDALGTLYAQLAATSSKLETAGEDLELVDVGFGKPGDYEGKEVTGKTVLISRGDISFAEKSINAGANGAKAAIIYNNAPGEIGGATLNGEDGTVPTYTISQESGLKLKEEVAKGEGHNHVVFNYKQEQDLLADLSSRGPSLPNYGIKPDITAPGVGIKSSIPAFGGDYTNAYEELQGTSMASPHVAGSAALLLEKTRQEGYHLKPEQIKALLTNNALLIKDRQDKQYGVNEQGAGRVDLKNTAEAQAIVKVQEELPVQLQDKTHLSSYSGSLSFGQQGAGTQTTRELAIDNISHSAQSYGVVVNWDKNAGITLVPDLCDITIKADQASAALSVSLSIPEGTAEGMYSGQIVFTQMENHHTMHVPFSVYVGNKYNQDEITNVELDPIYISTGDGGHGAKVYYSVNKKLEDYVFYVFRVNEDDTLNPVGYIYDEKFQKSLDPFYYSFDWDGTVDTGDQPGDQHVKLDPDGVYAIIPYVLNPGSETGTFLDDSGAAFLVDNSVPDATLPDKVTLDPGKPNTGLLQGTINGDMLLDYLYDGTNLQDLIHVKAGVGLSTNKDYKEYEGTIDEEGNFSVEVPLKSGSNTVQLFIYDDAGNGSAAPVKTYEYDNKPSVPSETEVGLTAVQSSTNTNEPFDISVDFKGQEDVHSITVDMTYDAKLSLNKVTPDSKVTVPDTAELSNGKKHVIFGIQFDEPVKEGTLARFNFTAAEAGSYSFEISNVISLQNAEGEEIDSKKLPGVTVDVTAAKDKDDTQNPDGNQAPDENQDTPSEPGTLPNPQPEPGQDPGSAPDPTSNPEKDPATQPETATDPEQGIQPNPDPDQGTEPIPAPVQNKDADQVSGSDHVTTTKFNSDSGIQLAADPLAELTSPAPVAPCPDPNPDPGTDPGTHPGDGSGSGTGSSGSSGSSSTPSTPAAPAAKKLTSGSLAEKGSGDQLSAILTIESTYLSGQLSNKDAKVITLDLSDVTIQSYHPLNIQLSSSLAEQLLKTNKDLVIKGKGIGISIPNQAISSFVTKDGLTIGLSFANSPTGNLQAPAGGSAFFVSGALTISEPAAPLSSPIAITLDLDPAKVNNRSKVGIFSWTKDGGWSYLAAGSSNPNVISFQSSKPGTFSAAEVSKSFDDINTHWAKNEIEVIASHNLANGKDSADTFKPNDQVTQAEFLSLLDRLLGTGKTWNERAAEQGSSHELTREELAVLLARSLGADLSGISSDLSFKDQKNIEGSARAAIIYTVKEGFLQGNLDQTFDPKGKLTRAQAAVILYRILQDLQSK